MSRTNIGRQRAGPRNPLAAALLFLLAWSAPERAQEPLYRDRTQPVDVRVADLLARMTVDEKVAQLLGVWQRRP